MIKANIIAYLRKIAEKQIDTTSCSKKESIPSSIKLLIHYIPMLLSEHAGRITYPKEMIKALQHMLIPIRNNRSYSRKEKHTDRKYHTNLK